MDTVIQINATNQMDCLKYNCKLLSQKLMDRGILFQSILFTGKLEGGNRK